MRSKEKKFDNSDTEAIKGIALLLLLFHHLFCEQTEYGLMIYNLAIFSKICLAIFVMLSGYGLAASSMNCQVGIYQFYIKRLSKIYFNYWFISLLFVPIGILYYGRTLESVYGPNAIIKFILTMFGFHAFIFGSCYNSTWWFISLIVALYILFPLLRYLIQRYDVYFLLILLFITFSRGFEIPVIHTWILPFALGIYFNKKNMIVSFHDRIISNSDHKLIFLIFTFVILAIIRTYWISLIDNKIDWLFSLILIIFSYDIFLKLPKLRKIFTFLGRHLFNIFLFHTFIYYYYYSEFIYSFEYPLIIFLNFLIICLLISILIEKLKEITNFNKIMVIPTIIINNTQTVERQEKFYRSGEK